MKHKKLIIEIALIICLVGVLIFVLIKGNSAQKKEDESTVSLFSNNSDGYNEIDELIREVYSDENCSESRPNVVALYDETRTDSNMPDRIFYDDVRYYKGQYYVENEYVGEKLGVDEKSGYEIYKINQMHQELSVAVKEKNAEKYHSYSMMYEEEHYYRPESLTETFDAIGFFENLKNVEVHIFDVQNEDSVIVYYDNTDDFKGYIMDKLKGLGDVKAAKTSQKRTGLSIMGILDHVEEPVTITFLENGNIMIDCGSATIHKLSFAAMGDGVDAAKDIIEYLQENAKGYIEYFPE
ncbi:MAG: hypothetical protein J6L69_11595 [Lachnospiraceae bacterium]|nr:hypothetical protein [Lachnospiraceae bacterium]